MYGVKAPKIKNITVKHLYTCEGDACRIRGHQTSMYMSHLHGKTPMANSALLNVQFLNTFPDFIMLKIICFYTF